MVVLHNVSPMQQHKYQITFVVKTLINANSSEGSFSLYYSWLFQKQDFCHDTLCNEWSSCLPLAWCCFSLPKGPNPFKRKHHCPIFVMTFPLFLMDVIWLNDFLLWWRSRSLKHITAMSGILECWQEYIRKLKLCLPFQFTAFNHKVSTLWW